MAAFVVAMGGKQVAILAPTTLLVRQHFQLLRERFEISRIPEPLKGTGIGLVAAGLIAAAAGAEVKAVHVGSDSDAETLLSEAASVMAEAGAGPEGLVAETRSGHPAAALEAAAEEMDAGLIVMGRGGEAVGRVTHQVSYRSPCDVLVVAGHEGRPDHSAWEA